MTVVAKIWLAGIAIAVLNAAGPARAADLSPVPYKAPPPAPVSSWTGFYLGGSLGIRSTTTDLTVDSALYAGVPDAVLSQFSPEHSFSGTAPRIGGYFGYNWQFAPQWLVGVEGDIGSADQTVMHPGFFLYGNQYSGEAADNTSVRSTWDASARGRLGYLVTPSTLLYATGGAAWLHIQSSAIGTSGFCGICGVPPSVISNSTVKTGWTIGGGIETALWGNWLLRAEYRYADFGSTTYTNTLPEFFGPFTATYDVKLRTQTALFGVAYKFGDPIAPTSITASIIPLKAPMVVASSGWTGPYLGVDAGFRSTVTDFTTDGETFSGVPQSLAGLDTSQPLDGTAFRYGGYIGYDWQFAQRYVAGIEGDIGSADHTETFNMEYLPTLGTGVTTDYFGVKTTWDASLRGRLGYLVTPSTLLYATGGVAWQNFQAFSVCNDQIFKFNPCRTTANVVTNSTTKAGWTLGAGVETKLWSNWVARAEYRYSDFGTTDYQLSLPAAALVANYDVKLRTHTALLGLAYKFDWDGPLATKY
jgi:outer membrane immunogenic protein